MKKTIRILSLALTLCLLLSAVAIPSLAYEQRKVTLDIICRDLKIVVDGVTITPKNVNGAFVEPFLYKGTTYLPVRAVAEALDRQVDWDGDTGTVYITTTSGQPATPKPGDGTPGTNLRKPVEVIYRDIGIIIDGVPVVPRDAAGNIVEPFLIAGTTYLPIRAVAEALGKEVGWDGDTGTVSIFDPEREDITVSTAAEFIDAIGSNRNLLLEPGIYNIAADDMGAVDNESVGWEEVFDGHQMDVMFVKNMTIRGVGEEPVELIVDPRYAYVMRFMYCRNIAIENVTAGHSEGGYCVGGVFGFNWCAGITIEKADMYGCGTEGLGLVATNGVTVRDSSIFECTERIIEIKICENILFENCLFRDNGKYSLVNIKGGENITFLNSEFRNNSVDDGYLFFAVSFSENIRVKNTKFIDNKAKILDESGVVTFENCVFEGNSFPIPTEPG